MMTGAYCRGCNTNWSQLPCQDVEDEQYVFCPLCLTDEFIEGARPEVTFSFNTITGQIINNETGVEVFYDPPPPPPVRPASYRDRTNDAIMRGRHKG